VQIVFVCMVDVCWMLKRESLGIPRPKNSGVVNIIMRGRTCAIRNNGIIHPRNTISSDAGPCRR
jgi:hypothetical protein